MVLALAGISAALLLAVLYLRPYAVIRIRPLAIPALCILFIAGLLFFSDMAVDAARNGLKLWAGTVVPALLPFFIAAEIMNSTGFTRVFGTLLEPVMRPLFKVPGSASFAFVMGISSGYPVGAKITSDLRKKGLLTRIEAERLLSFTNNSGPLFIIGAVGTGMCGSPETGAFLLACHLTACITVGLIYRFYGNREDQSPKKLRMPGRSKSFRNVLSGLDAAERQNLGTILGEAVKNSVSVILTIGGFIVLFSVIIRILSETGVIRHLAGMLSLLFSPLGADGKTIEGVLSGLLEITTGTRLVSMADAPPHLKLPALSFIIGWAGLSVHLQVTSIISGTGIRTPPYLLAKFLQGVISAFYTWAGLKMLHIPVFAGMQAPEGISAYAGSGWNAAESLKIAGNSFLIILLIFMLLIIITALSREVKKHGTRKRSPI
ncbi:MAG: sporulation integral membrane protein YlbJ [Bacillota bacterium]